MSSNTGKEPRKLTEAVEKRLCEAIALGCSKAIAARLAGIDPATLWRWTEQGEADLAQEKASAYCKLCNALKDMHVQGDLHQCARFRGRDFEQPRLLCP
jgi:hypothetical protein